ncbi:MAG: hypothetical protein DYG89_29335 [Caldilinea sp. CFX5]|nr:hypothetical protein [Caldilinea sp. CFX5]
MNSTFIARWQQLQQATTVEAIFPNLATLSPALLKQQYHLLAAAVHPDHNRDYPAQATEAFARLQQWYKIAQQQVGMRTNGAAHPIEIITRQHRYVSNDAPIAGDLCDLYPAGADQQAVLLKVVRSPRNNDLLQTEAQVLQRLARTLQGQAVRAHFPTLIEAVQLRDVAGVQRHVNILAYESDYVSLAAVLRAYPTGIAAADAAWMFNRLLAALGVVHGLGLVHGAVTLDHCLIRLHDHNGLLLDWCYSVPIGETIKAVNLAYTADYPPEVHARQPATAATDLYMAARCLLRLLGGDPTTGDLPAHVPKPIQLYLYSCLLPSPHRRANDAWELFDEFQTILGQFYGPPRFRPFVMPA